MWSYLQRFYTLNLFKELRKIKPQLTKIYEYCKNVSLDTLIKSYANDLLKYFGIFVSEDNKHLPSVYL